MTEWVKCTFDVCSNEYDVRAHHFWVGKLKPGQHVYTVVRQEDRTAVITIELPLHQPIVLDRH